ncbi:MAG: MBL fold metallo-hydrolase [Armatimonadota bacterium]
MAELICYDGVGCIGGNKILLKTGETRLFLDFGLNFGIQGRFYQEFLQPKSVAGLFEPIEMGILPPFRGMYRDDLVSRCADPYRECSKEWEDPGEINAILLSHAHVDHMGLLNYVREDIPIFCSPMTLAIARALQDTAGGSVPAEYCYYVPRQDGENGSGLATPHQSKQPSLSRHYAVTSAPSKELETFWGGRPGERGHIPRELRTVEDVAGCPVKSWPVDHSLYGATAWAVQTDAGWVVYTGDLRTHGRAGQLTWRFAEEAAALEPVALIIEGTRINSSQKYTEQDVRDASLDRVKECSGLVVADFGPRNVERLLSFLEVARQTGRRLAILPKDAYLLHTMQKAADSHQMVPSLNDPCIVIYRELSGTNPSWQKVLWEDGNLDGRIVAPADIRNHPGDYIICLSFFDLNELAYLRPPEGSIWIYSACEALNEEMEIDAARMRAWLDHYRVRLVGNLTNKDHEEDPFHVSGHASGEDLVRITEIIHPQKLIPVHTEHPDLFRQKMPFTEVVLPEPGKPIFL